MLSKPAPDGASPRREALDLPLPDERRHTEPEHASPAVVVVVVVPMGTAGPCPPPSRLWWVMGLAKGLRNMRMRMGRAFQRLHQPAEKPRNTIMAVLFILDHLMHISQITLYPTTFTDTTVQDDQHNHLGLGPVTGVRFSLLASSACHASLFASQLHLAYPPC